MSKTNIPIKVKIIDLENLHVFLDKLIQFNGKIIKNTKGKTRNGKPYAIIDLNDQNSSFTLHFFGDYYKSFAPILNLNNKLKLTAKVEKNWDGKEKLELVSISHKHITLLLKKENFEFFD